MRRLFWVAVGAAGGILAYRRGSEALAQARERGVVGNVTAATVTATRVGSRAVTAGSRAATMLGELTAAARASSVDARGTLAPSAGGTGPATSSTDRPAGTTRKG